jgi:acyl-CoA synthetase (NDP forming)
VAVVGASNEIRGFSGAPIHNLLGHGFKGEIYPVNPKREEILGIRCYPSLLEVPGTIDTVVIAVPTAAVMEALRQAVQLGIRSATVVSSGFGEAAAGPEGQVRAAELEELIESSGIRVLGPNTAGLANLVDGYVPRAAHNQWEADRVKPGPAALFTQSGACGNIIYNRAQAHGVGIGLSVATGDQVDIDVWELCDFAMDDPRFQTVMVVAETLGDTARLEHIAVRAHAAGKVVAVLKLGQSDIGRQAVMTHSGSLAGDSAVQAAALRELGVVQVEELDDLWRLAGLIEAWGPPPASPGRLGVVALSGGEGALIADLCARAGLDLPPTSDAFAAFISANFQYAMASNPFDPSGEIVGKPEKVRLALRAFMELNDYSEVLIASPVLRAEQAERQLGEVREIAADPHPHLCFSYWAAGDLTRTQLEILSATGQPVFSGSGSAVRAIAQYRRAGARARSVQVQERHGSASTLLPGSAYFDVRAQMASLGIEFTPAALAHTVAEAVLAGESIGYPCVMKANVASSVHKFANGLIALDVRDQRGLERAFAELTAAGRGFDAAGVVVEAYGAGQVEVMIGAHRDPDLGPTVLFGSGGTMVEFFQDSALGIARYLDAAEAEAVVRSTHMGSFLGHRAPETVATLAGILVSVAAWFTLNPQLDGLDLNPLLVDLATGAVVCVDARVA